ncbi:MAG: Kelch repeat-containing protein, partial [Myxococcota bacterium]
DAPRPRDHFHAAVIGDALYVAGGRLSGGAGGVFAPLVPEVDVYDFTTGTWSTLPAASDLPTPRAGTASAAFEGKLLVIGGEGGGQAWDTVEALDPATGSWSTLDSLNFARHGMQAIVSGPGVFVVGGSPSQGGGNQKNMEVYQSDAPVGSPSVAGLPNAPLNVPFDGWNAETIPISHVAGNEGIYVESLSLSGPDLGDFTIKTLLPDPFLLPVGGSQDVVVDYAGATPGAMAFLDVTYGGGQTLSVILLPEPGLVASLAAGAALLGALARRRR